MNIGAIIDKLIYFGIGAYCIFLSIKQKEKLGNKAVMARLAGIIFIGLSVLYTILALVKK